jgi:hypothetical protein
MLLGEYLTTEKGEFDKLLYFRVINKISDKPFTSFYWILISLTIIIRIIIGLNSKGIYHPDELFQSLEPAHYQAFGFGYLAPEFRNEYDHLDYYAKSRSWLFPLIFTGIMKLGSTFGLNYYQHTLLLIDIVIILNSILVIFAIKYLVEVYTDNAYMGMIASLFVALWWRAIHLSTRLFTNTFFLALLFFTIARTIKAVRSDQEISIFDKLTIIFGLGMVTYIRLDLGIIVFFFALTELIQYNKNKVVLNLDLLGKYGKILLLGLLGWLFGMIVDYNLYESHGIYDLIQVPRNWFFFNVIRGYSKIFGLQPYGWYFENLIIYDGLFSFVYLSLLTILLSLLIQYQYRKIDNEHENYLIQLEMKQVLVLRKELFLILLMSIVIVCSWNIYESPFEAGLTFWQSLSHKELRFITNVLILLLAYYGMIIVHLANIVQFIIVFKYKNNAVEKAKFSPLKSALIPKFSTILLLLLLFSNSMTYSVDRYPSEVFADTNKALVWVGDNGINVTGVIVVLVWFYTGMYTYLHQDVPIHTISNVSDDFNTRFTILYAEANYLIVPRYQYNQNSLIKDFIDERGWIFLMVIDHSVEIYRLI